MLTYKGVFIKCTESAFSYSHYWRCKGTNFHLQVQQESLRTSVACGDGLRPKPWFQTPSYLGEKEVWWRLGCSMWNNFSNTKGLEIHIWIWNLWFWPISSSSLLLKCSTEFRSICSVKLIKPKLKDWLQPFSLLWYITTRDVGKSLTGEKGFSYTGWYVRRAPDPCTCKPFYAKPTFARISCIFITSQFVVLQHKWETLFLQQYSTVLIWNGIFYLWVKF